jgi:hypothetical protein
MHFPFKKKENQQPPSKEREAYLKARSRYLELKKEVQEIEKLDKFIKRQFRLIEFLEKKKSFNRFDKHYLERLNRSLLALVLKHSENEKLVELMGRAAQLQFTTLSPENQEIIKTFQEMVIPKE